MTTTQRAITPNRELGIISFYQRVLAQASCQTIPILERLNYLKIVAKGCDELFEVRIAKILEVLQRDSQAILHDGDSAKNTIQNVHLAMNEFYAKMATVYSNSLLPELAKSHIQILTVEQLNLVQQEFIYNYFITNIKPILVPISIGHSQPFPKLWNKEVYFIVEICGHDSFDRASKFAIIEYSALMPQIIGIPDKLSPHNYSFIFIQDVVRHYIHLLFPEAKIKQCIPFRITRGANLKIIDNDKTHIVDSVSDELKNRQFATVIRLEVAALAQTHKQNAIKLLLKELNLHKQSLFLVSIPLALASLHIIYDHVDQTKLKYPKYTPSTPEEIIRYHDIFMAIDRHDILIHTPFQSFDPIVELTKQASLNNDVIAIKITIYRHGFTSPLIDNLATAAKHGKQVTVVIELFARFDEEANLELAKTLEQSGVTVLFGISGYKVHAKMLMIVKRHQNALQRYVHLSTGNYNPTTAKLYTDFHLLTKNHDIAEDVSCLFNQITAFADKKNLKQLLHSPFNLHQFLLHKIDSEINYAKSGKKAQIIVKLNAIAEEQIIAKLYAASQAGVQITLIVRGFCAVVPNIPKISENIKVYSTIGRFLEHSRILYFYNNGNHDVYLTSADWLYRNFFRRLEIAVPILDAKIKMRIVKEALLNYIEHNNGAWQLQNNGEYLQINTLNQNHKKSAQTILMEKFQQS